MWLRSHNGFAPLFLYSSLVSTRIHFPSLRVFLVIVCGGVCVVLNRLTFVLLNRLGTDKCSWCAKLTEHTLKAPSFIVWVGILLLRETIAID